MTVRMEAHHASREICVGAKPQPGLGEGLLLCRVMAVVAGNVFPACYVCMFTSFFVEVPKQDWIQGYLLQGASRLMSQSEICSYFFQVVALRPNGA